MSPHKATLCVNTKARQLDKTKLAELESIFKKHNIAYNVLTPLSLKNASPKNLAPLLVAVGGDGTVNLVAEAALKHGRKLAVVPQGTFNHFAKDLGLPLDMQKAAQKTIKGKNRQVDVGQVNGRIFLNNSVLGFYPHLVAKRENLQGKFGKWIALVIATSLVLLKIRRYRLQLSIDGKTVKVKTTLLVIANNQYDLEGFGLAARDKLDESKLYIYAVKSKNIPGVLGVSLRLLLGKAGSKDFDCYEAKAVTVTSKKTTFRVALDGESTRMKTPLNYKILPKSLTVLY